MAFSSVYNFSFNIYNKKGAVTLNSAQLLSIYVRLIVPLHFGHLHVSPITFMYSPNPHDEHTNQSDIRPLSLKYLI